MRADGVARQGTGTDAATRMRWKTHGEGEAAADAEERSELRVFIHGGHMGDWGWMVRCSGMEGYFGLHKHHLWL